MSKPKFDKTNARRARLLANVRKLAELSLPQGISFSQKNNAIDAAKLAIASDGAEELLDIAYKLDLLVIIGERIAAALESLADARGASS